MIEVTKKPEEGSTLYLTMNGRVIWNLNYAPYTAYLEKGVTDNFGLRLVISNAPTSFEEVTVDNPVGEIQKVLINGEVYVVRGGEVYTITGVKIK